MNAKIIKKYSKYEIKQLLKMAERWCNKYIRFRDEGAKCISCDNPGTEAGHYYSAGHYSTLRFNEININLQCSRCNRHLHGNLIEYRKGLVEKIGEEGVKELDDLVAAYKRISFKWDRFTLIETIEKYKQKCKEYE